MMSAYGNVLKSSQLRHINMAAIRSLLVQCLSTNRHVNMLQTVSYSCSFGMKFFKGHQLVSLNVLSRRLHTTLFPSQMVSIGHFAKQAVLGFKTGGDSYETYRPGYTDESVDLIVSEIVSSSEAAKASSLKCDVLELGSGTGKLTERLSKKLPSHLKYVATEPSENFLDVLKLKGLNVDVAIATADSIPLAENSAGSVVCAHSFHWFSGKENLESIHKVLIPGGKLILIWNMKQFNHEWMSVFYEQRKEVIKKIGGSMKDLFNSMEWRRDIDASEHFKLLCHKSLPGIKCQGDVEAVLSNLTTISYNLLPPTERNAYVNQLRQILISWPGLDLNNITIPYTTELYIFTAQ